MSKEHPHAELLRAIADGKTIISAAGRLSPDYVLTLIAEDLVYSLTIAPETIVVNAIEIPAPYRGGMSEGQKYWVADPTHKGYATPMYWRDEAMNRLWMARGLIHLSAEAAAAHGRAMCAPTMKGGAA